MTTRINGISVTLVNQVEVGTDEFNHSIYSETETIVENVLVAPSSTNEVLESTDLYGKKAVYTIAIPKGDTHIWEDQKVIFFGIEWRVFSLPMSGIESNIPLDWNTKYYVERYA